MITYIGLIIVELLLAFGIKLGVKLCHKKIMKKINNMVPPTPEMKLTLPAPQSKEPRLCKSGSLTLILKMFSIRNHEGPLYTTKSNTNRAANTENGMSNRRVDFLEMCSISPRHVLCFWELIGGIFRGFLCPPAN